MTNSLSLWQSIEQSFMCYTIGPCWLSILNIALCTWDFPIAQIIRKLPAMQKTWVQSLGQEDPLEKEVATHFSILAWRIPWTEDLGGLQSMGSQRGTHNWVTNTSLLYRYFWNPPTSAPSWHWSPSHLLQPPLLSKPTILYTRWEGFLQRIL